MDKNGKIGTNKVIGQPKTGTMRVANATSSGFGIIYADEIIGHRRVDTFKDLELIPNWALYDQAGGADISTAKGQLWYVSGDSKLYQLTEIDATGADRTWTEFKGTDSSYSLPLMSTAQRGGAKLGNDTTQTTDANPVTTTVNRTYAVQKNVSEQLVVNVPWVDTDNNTTYKFEDGIDGSFTVTPSGGTAKKVNIGTPENANHANMANSAGSATNDAQGHSIHLTYATKTEMASGLNVLNSKISALTSALVYKGTVNATNHLPTQGVKVGDVYVVAAPGIYAEQICENGDMIIAKVGGNIPEWTIVQTNIDGAITIWPNEKLTKDCIVVGASNDNYTSVIGLAPSAGYLYWDGKKYVWKTPAEFNLTRATEKALGGIKTGFTSTNNRQYAVQLDDNDKAFVNVPWTDTEYSLPVATDDTFGGIRLNFTTSGKNYPVKLTEDGDAYVYVPWTDTNTTYTADKGIDITNNVISWTSQAASNLSDALHDGFDGYLICIKQTLDASGIKTLTYRTGGDNGTNVDIVKIYDTTTGAGEGLASIKAVTNTAKSLQKSITDETGALKASISNLGTTVDGKVNVADMITTGEIDKLFTNN